MGGSPWGLDRLPLLFLPRRTLKLPLIHVFVLLLLEKYNLTHSKNWLGSILVVWLLSPRVQLLVPPLGLLGCPGVLSGSQPALAACVWLPDCVIPGLSLSCLSLGGSCAPSIVFVTWHLTMYKFISGAASLSRLENPMGLFWEIYIDWLIDRLTNLIFTSREHRKPPIAKFTTSWKLVRETAAYFDCSWMSEEIGWRIFASRK